jgi:hypothetical protein
MTDWLLVIAIGALLACILLLIAAIIEAYYEEKRAKEGKGDDWIWSRKFLVHPKNVVGFFWF